MSLIYDGEAFGRRIDTRAGVELMIWLAVQGRRGGLLQEFRDIFKGVNRRMRRGIPSRDFIRG